MDFSYDIYISYAKSDNQIEDGKSGWVTNFKKFLEILLIQIVGEKPVFLGYSNEEKPASSELAKSAIFISVLSPTYIENESCVEELNDFVDIANKNNNLHINELSRLFKVVKYPIALKEQPTKLQNLLSFDLFYVDNQSGEAEEFKDFFTLDAERKYWLKLIDLAYDIATRIKSFRKLDLQTPTLQTYSNKTVYLAEAGFDLQLHRDNIKRELLRHGFRVLPESTLPLNVKEMELAIKRDLEKSRLSIHLIGDSYGELAYNSDKSILDFQNKLAGDHCTFTSAVVGEIHKFNRLIWISPEAQLHNDKQKIFVDNLRRDLESIEGAEIIQSPIEDFKMVVLEELLDLNLDKLKLIETSNFKSSKPTIYLIFDRIDEYDAKKLASQLIENNFEVITPSFEGQLLELREIHLSNLRKCDWGLVFMNNVNDLWVQMKFLDLLKAPGLGRNKGEISKALVFGKQSKDRSVLAENFEIPVFEFNDSINTALLNHINK